MRILAFGAGAVGTYIGGSLALNGHEVVFLERPKIAEELAQRGISLKIEEDIHTIPDPLLADSLQNAIEQGPYDLVLFAIKSYDTQSALEELTPFREQIAPILCLQNGVENEKMLTAVMGTDRVISATLTSAITRQAAGDIILERLRGVGIEAEHPISQDLAGVMNQAGLNARLYARAADMKWSKMLTNLLANASSAILNMSPGEIFEHPKLYKIEAAQIREALKVMRAENIHVVDLPGTPVRALSFAIRSLPVKLSRTLLKNAVGSGRGGKMPSFHIDLHSGKGQSEVDYLNGAVIRFGERQGIAVPVNRFLNDTLLGMLNGSIPMDRYDHKPQNFLEDIQAKLSPSISL